MITIVDNEKTEITIENFKIVVEHWKQENFGRFSHGHWDFTLYGLDGTSVIKEGQCIQISQVCYELHYALLMTDNSPKPISALIGINQLRNSLEAKLNNALSYV